MTKQIKTYEIFDVFGGKADMGEHQDGKWIKKSDHDQEIAKLTSTLADKDAEIARIKSDLAGAKECLQLVVADASEPYMLKGIGCFVSKDTMDSVKQVLEQLDKG